MSEMIELYDALGIMLTAAGIVFTAAAVFMFIKFGLGEDLRSKRKKQEFDNSLDEGAYAEEDGGDAGEDAGDIYKYIDDTGEDGTGEDDWYVEDEDRVMVVHDGPEKEEEKIYD